MTTYVLINKKTKLFAKQDCITMKFSDTDNVFNATKYSDCSVFYVQHLLKFFRIKSKYEIHCLIIKTIKSPT